MSFMRRSSKKRLRRKKVSQVTPTLMKYVRRPGNFLGKFENHEKCLICQKTFSKRWNNFFFFFYNLYIFSSKHAKRHPNFNTNALRQRRLTLANHVASTMTGPSTHENPKKLNKADSVNSSEDNSTGSNEPSEEPQYSDKMSDSLPSP